VGKAKNRLPKHIVRKYDSLCADITRLNLWKQQELMLKGWQIAHLEGELDCNYRIRLGRKWRIILHIEGMDAVILYLGSREGAYRCT